MTLWRDKFRIDIEVTTNPYMGNTEKYIKYFEGSLKGAIRSVLAAGYVGNVTAVFYTSKGEYIKEIGF